MRRGLGGFERRRERRAGRQQGRLHRSHLRQLGLAVQLGLFEDRHAGGGEVVAVLAKQAAGLAAEAADWD